MIMMDIDKLLRGKEQEHQDELSTLEERISEKIGLVTEFDNVKEEDYFSLVKNFKLLGYESWGYRDPPRMKKLYPPPPVMPAATTDWDIPCTSWYLDTISYTSVPSSLAIQSSFGVACKYAGTTNLSQGRIATQTVYTQGASDIDLTLGFLINETSGSFTWNTSRIMPTYGSALKIYPLAAGIRYWRLGTNVFNYNLSTTARASGTWYNIRATWWKSVEVYVFRAEQVMYVTSTWTKMTADFTDPNYNLSDIARVSIGGPGTGSYRMLFDDTEIWGP